MMSTGPIGVSAQESNRIAGKGEGVRDRRHLWPALRHLIRVKQPQLVFGEQVAKKAGKLWMDGVAYDLEACGYRVGACVLSASCYGATHKRERFYFVADTTSERRFRYVNEWRLSLLHLQSTQHDFLNSAMDSNWGPLEPRPESVPADDGISPEMARFLLHGYGNAIHIPTAVSFIQSYMEELVDNYE
jgi:DNA (cytosine-5)-methyltransferase 1